MFSLELLPSQTLLTESTETGRFYQTPIGPLQSVTDILGRAFDTKELDAWRKRIGEEAANQVSMSATNRGTAVHKIFEEYIQSKPDWRKALPVNLALFLKAKPFLDKNLSRVFGIEHQMFSSVLKTAGTADLIAEWNGRFNAITDYKTSRQALVPNSKILHKYRLQTTVYAMMVEEMYGLSIPYSVIIILIADNDPQYDIVANKQFREEVTEIFNKEKYRVT